MFIFLKRQTVLQWPTWSYCAYTHAQPGLGTPTVSPIARVVAFAVTGSPRPAELYANTRTLGIERYNTIKAKPQCANWSLTRRQSA